MNPSLPLAYGLMRRTDNLSSSQTSRKAAKNVKDFYMFQFLVSYGSNWSWPISWASCSSKA